MRYRILGCLGATLLAAACAPSAPSPDPAQERAEFERALQPMVAEWDRSLNAGDADATMALYVPDGPVALPPNQPAADGADAVRALIQQISSTPGFRVENRIVDFDVDGHLAVARGTYRIFGTGGAPDITGKWAGVWRKQADGSWKTVYNIWNTDAPMPQAAPGAE